MATTKKLTDDPIVNRILGLLRKKGKKRIWPIISGYHPAVYRSGIMTEA